MTTYSEAVEQTITAGEQIHQIVNGTATTEVTIEDGSKIPSVRKALVDNFYFKDPLIWQSGQQEVVFNQLRKFTDGTMWYAPNATASNPITMGATPVGDNNWKIYSLDAVVKLTPQIRESLRRSYAEAGYTLVSESFETGGIITSANVALLFEAEGKAYSWGGALPKLVSSGSTPNSSGGIGANAWVDISYSLLRTILTPKAGSGSFTPYGGQLALLGEDLLDPLVQEMQITFIGDSITWGTGSSGQSPSGTRDKTLSDPRNNGTSPSFVNEFGRWVEGVLGAGAVTTFSNHPASPSGESVRTITAVKNEFPIGGAYAVAGTGSFTDKIETNITGPALRGHRTLSVAPGATASLSFNFTGSEFTFIYSQIGAGANYELKVDGVVIGIYSTSGATKYNVRRTHSFGYIKDKIVTITALPVGGVTSQLRVEGFSINKTIRIKNQGIIGIYSGQYVTFNMPSSVNILAPELPSEIPSYLAEVTGSGSHSYSVESNPSAARGKIYQYGFLDGGQWTITVNPAENTDRMTVFYTSNEATAGFEVYDGDVLLDTFYTASTEPGNTFGYGKSHVVSFPKGTTTLTIKTLFRDYGIGVLYLKLEALQFSDSSVVTYPLDNYFGDGVALDIKDSYAFVQLGINDRGAAQVSSPSAIRSSLNSLVSLFPQYCRPIFMAPNNSEDSVGVYFNNADVMQAIRQEAKRLGVDFINNRALFEGYTLSQYTTDGLHPNDFGHKLICENIITSIVRG